MICYNYDVGFQQPGEYKEKVFSKTWYLASYFTAQQLWNLETSFRLNSGTTSQYTKQEERQPVRMKSELSKTHCP